MSKLMEGVLDWTGLHWTSVEIAQNLGPHAAHCSLTVCMWLSDHLVTGKSVPLSSAYAHTHTHRHTHTNTHTHSHSRSHSCTHSHTHTHTHTHSHTHT